MLRWWSRLPRTGQGKGQDLVRRAGGALPQFVQGESLRDVPLKCDEKYMCIQDLSPHKPPSQANQEPPPKKKTRQIPVEALSTKSDHYASTQTSSSKIKSEEPSQTRGA